LNKKEAEEYDEYRRKRFELEDFFTSKLIEYRKFLLREAEKQFPDIVREIIIINLRQVFDQLAPTRNDDEINSYWIGEELDMPLKKYVYIKRNELNEEIEEINRKKKDLKLIEDGDKIFN
jgi:Succinate dehydrogenase/fumarate reductase, flavoprotein subunit